jgi:Fur family ferric uptake transcriptional regulator
LACSGIYLVSEVLSELHDFGRVPEFHPALRERGGSVGLTTADRDLVLMVETGDVDILTRDAGEAVYFRCTRHDHRYLVCQSCGYALEITVQPRNDGLMPWLRVTGTPTSATP